MDNQKWNKKSLSINLPLSDSHFYYNLSFIPSPFSPPASWFSMHSIALLTFTLLSSYTWFRIKSPSFLSLLRTYLTVLPFSSFKTALLKVPFVLCSLYLPPAFHWTLQNCPGIRFPYTCTPYLLPAFHWTLRICPDLPLPYICSLFTSPYLPLHSLI